MKKNKGLAKFFIVLTIITGALTVFLLYARTQQTENNNYIEINSDTMKLIQLEPPKDGIPIACSFTF